MAFEDFDVQEWLQKDCKLPVQTASTEKIQAVEVVTGNLEKSTILFKELRSIRLI